MSPDAVHAPSLSPEVQGGEQRPQGCRLAQSKVSAHGKEAFGTLTDLSTGEGEGWVTWH